MVKFFHVMRSVLRLIISLALACVQCAPAPVTTEGLAPNEFIIAMTNDFHGAVDRAEGLASVILELRAKYGKRLIYLDAGDQFQGSVEANMSKGKAVVDLFNFLQLDAAAIGNHELDYGADVPDRVTVKPGEDGMGNLKRRVNEATYPWLSANIIVDPSVACEPGDRCNAMGQATVFQPRTVIERDGKKFCVIGGTTATTPNITSRDFVRGTKFIELAQVVEKEAKWFRANERCDCILLLVHEGLRYQTDALTLKPTGLKQVLDRVKANSIDAAIGGHSHIRVQEFVNSIPVIQAGMSAQVVGILRVRFADGRKNFQFGPFLKVSENAQLPDITKVLEPYRNEAEPIKTRPVGSSAAEFLRSSFSETALGNMVADALLAAGKKYGAQFSLMNAGGIRAGLPAGPLSYDNVFRVMPFDNQLSIVKLKGSELNLLLEVAFSGSEGLPSVSGLIVERKNIPLGKRGPWDRDLDRDGRKEEWERNVVVQIRDSSGKAISPNRMYTLATISYLVQSGDYQNIVYDHVPKERILVLQDVFVRDVIADYFEQNSPLRPESYFSDQFRRIRTSAMTSRDNILATPLNQAGSASQ